MTEKITSDEFEIRCVNFNGVYDNSIYETIVGSEPGIVERGKEKVRNLVADSTNSVPVIPDAWEQHAPKVQCFLNAAYAPEHFRIEFIVPHILTLYPLAEDAKTWNYVLYLLTDGTKIKQSCGKDHYSELVGTILSVYWNEDGKKLFHADIAPLIEKFKSLCF